MFYENLHGAYTLPDTPHGADHDPRVEDEEVLEARLRKAYPGLWKFLTEYD